INESKWHRAVRMRMFVINQRVRVKIENPGPNRRVPDYVRGKLGVIVGVHGTVPNYSHDHSENWGPLYSVLFGVQAPDSHSKEKIIVDIHESWLVAAPRSEERRVGKEWRTRIARTE